MKQKFTTPILTAFGPLEKITQEFDRSEDREREQSMEEAIGDDIESAAVVRPELDEEFEH
ncbi:hypothetical protein ACSYAD_05585 [Acaryochloris marina NIES-2412]|uniref:hypothetical protein n=1 Tax=Acaryochloris marina TaxID=155978 RepID=UPI00405862F8